MAVVSMKQLLEAGCHFGHTTRRWDPRMKEYIFAAKSGIYIIDLKITVEKIHEAYDALLKIVQNGGQVMFLGTKKQAQDAVKEAALKTNQFYVNQRWLGGTLTNFKTIRLRIKELNDIIEKEETGYYNNFPKKEVLEVKKLREKLEKNLSGIKEMKRIPDALFAVDPSKEVIAIKEAKILGIPVFAIVDTNCDPSLVDYVIPSNDDATRAVKLITDVMTNAVIEGQGGEVEHVADEDVEMVLEDDIKPRKREFKPRDDFKKKEHHTQSKPRDSKKEEKKEKHEEKVVEPKAEKKEKQVEEKPAKKQVVVEKVEKQEEKVDALTHTEEVLNQLTVPELKELAKKQNLSGYSKLRKHELIALILGL